MAKRNESGKGIALVILGVVAIIAIVGLVLLFVQGKNATGQGIYGGAAKRDDPFPYWTLRGTPRNAPAQDYLWPTTASKDLTTNWNNYGAPKRSPYVDIPSVQTACPGGFKISSSDSIPAFYRGGDYEVVEVAGTKGAFACVYPRTPMVGGVAGFN